MWLIHFKFQLINCKGVNSEFAQNWWPETIQLYSSRQGFSRTDDHAGNSRGLMNDLMICIWHRLFHKGTATGVFFLFTLEPKCKKGLSDNHIHSKTCRYQEKTRDPWTCKRQGVCQQITRQMPRSAKGIKSKSKTFATRCLLTVSSEGAAIKPAWATE